MGFLGNLRVKSLKDKGWQITTPCVIGLFIYNRFVEEQIFVQGCQLRLLVVIR